MKCASLVLKASVFRGFEQCAINSFRIGPAPLLLVSFCNYSRGPKSLVASTRTFYSNDFSSDDKLSKEKTKYVDQEELSRKGMGLQEKGETTKDGQIVDAFGDAKEKQTRTPWHREGPEQPPIRKLRSGREMPKGKLLTTPSHLLKLILPLPALDRSTHRRDIGRFEPLALLVHPRQPLSYLERLMQAELPMIKSKTGEDKVPDVWFWAEGSAQEEYGRNTNPNEMDQEDLEVAEEEREEQGTDEPTVDGKLVGAGKMDKDELKNLTIARALRGGPGEGGIETYSGLGRETPKGQEERKFVRWSSSTEIGDFIRDAARGREFAVEIEGARNQIRVGVPSFSDRTHYLRVRLRKTAKQLDGMAKIKRECDRLANRSAQRLSICGFGVLVAWWASIYHFTFRTDYGWDTMEPITYLAGLSTIILGYLYFLWHNREVSYRSALHITVSHRQHQLYTERGFDIARWESLVEEANALRKEIKGVANEYDVEWDEKKDETSEIVHQALSKERRKKVRVSSDEEEEEEEARPKKRD